MLSQLKPLTVQEESGHNSRSCEIYLTSLIHDNQGILLSYLESGGKYDLNGSVVEFIGIEEDFRVVINGKTAFDLVYDQVYNLDIDLARSLLC